MINLIGRVWIKGGEHYVTPSNDNKQQLVLLSGNYESGFSLTSERVMINEVKFNIPFQAGKLFGIGKNYPSEGDIGSQMSFFLMAHNALLPNLSTLYLSRRIGSVIPEGELGVVISKTTKDVSSEEALKSILGYTICNDFSAREVDLPEIPSAIKKSSDGLLPVGPFLFLNNQFRSFDIRTYKNELLVQSGSSSTMLNKIPDIISFISSFITLNRFDLITTGTPGPKALAYRGDTIKIEIDEIGLLETKIE